MTTAVYAQAQVRPLTGDAELFVDDVAIQQSSGLQRTLHQAEKLEQPVLKPDKPWEKGRIYIYGTVHRDPQTGKFRMWYSGGGLAYAESDDGVHWVKPELPYVQRDGQPTNVLLEGSNVCFVIIDPHAAEPDKTYKALDNTGHFNFNGFYSADGLQWHAYDKSPLVPYGSEISNGMRDPQTGLYYVYIRPYLPKFFPKDNTQKRLVAVITSPDFVNWSEPKLIIEPDRVDDAWVNDEVQRTEFYGMSGFPYGSQYLGLLPVFRITTIQEKTEPLMSRYEGPIDAQLVFSRDGLTWHRTEDRTPVIPTGPHAYDAGCIMNVSSKPVIFNDQIYYYYTALSTTHGGKVPEKVASIALARWRLDGFVSLDAEQAGMVETTAWSSGGGLLIVNANAAGGRIVVSLLDPATGNPLPGYSAADCQAITTDDVRHQVRWTSHETLPSDRPFRIRFELQPASIYSYHEAMKEERP
ncbi:MAG: hypothetical protein IT445_07715 [Phycisphaeraceae bacterium]|nr:hypothetical protein [Phycisphaeraceae bacterium]